MESASALHLPTRRILMRMPELDELLDKQSGLVTRAQLMSHGTTRTELARGLRRGELVVVHPGVYVGHNGPLVWLERAWAAVLWAAPAALSHESAKRAFEARRLQDRDDAPIHLLVERSRHLKDRPGVVLHRSAHYDTRVLASMTPPRVRYDHVVLDLAAAAKNDLDAVAVLADACGSRRTNAVRLLTALASRPRISRRVWLRDVLHDVATGTCSVLEHGYLDLVERPHGLPLAKRQAPQRGTAGKSMQDATYEDWKFVVELDGRIFHSSAEDRDQDLERDLDSVIEREQTTVRLGYRQVFARPCRTAVKVGAVLTRLGWAGAVRPCPKCGGQDQAA